MKLWKTEKSRANFFQVTLQSIKKYDEAFHQGITVRHDTNLNPV